jgi:hypothetical protein
MNATPPSRTASAAGAPAGMPARLWEVAKHGARGTIPPWVRAAPDAGATAPPRIGQIARRAAQVAAAAGAVGAGIGLGVGATEAASPPVDLANRGDGAAGTGHASGGGAPGADHTSADHISADSGTGSPASSDSGAAPGPPGSASEGQVTLHTSGDGGHLATGLATTWRIPGHGAAGGGHGEAGAEGGHDGLTVEMYQDVVVHEGADGMFSVDAVEYVVVRDEHNHAYVFREDYHTVVPDPPGQETDLVIHETDRAQVVEHPDGSFSVTQADNSISVTVGSDGDGQHDVTVTQTESVQFGHDPDADGHDTVSLTENEYGATTADQSEVVSEQTVPPTAGTQQPSAPMAPPTASAAAPSPAGTASSAPTASAAASSQAGAALSGVPETYSAAASSSAGAAALSAASSPAGAGVLSVAPETLPAASPPAGAAPLAAPETLSAASSSPGAAALSAAPASAAAPSLVGTTPSTLPETFSAARVMATPPPLATSLGVAATTVGGLASGHEPHPPSAFAGFRGGSAEPGHGAAPAGPFPNEPVPAQHPAGDAFDSAASSAAPGPFEHPTTEPLADAPRPDPLHGAAFAGHDQPGLEEPGAHGGIDPAAVDPTEPDPSADAHSAGEYEVPSGVHPDSSAGPEHAPAVHGPGTDTTVIH